MKPPLYDKEREGKRHPCDMEVVVDGVCRCSTFDISEGGVYVSTDHVFRDGSIVAVTFPFRGGTLDVKARVQHCFEGIGVGLMFVDLDAALKKKIKALVRDVIHRR